MTLNCNSKAQETVLDAVVGERSYQDQKWGSIAEHPHEVGSWLTIMRKLLTDAEAAYAGRRGDAGALEEVRKVVATGVACMEQHGAPPRVRKSPEIAIEAYREAGSSLAG